MTDKEPDAWIWWRKSSADPNVKISEVSMDRNKVPQDRSAEPLYTQEQLEEFGGLSKEKVMKIMGRYEDSLSKEIDKWSEREKEAMDYEIEHFFKRLKMQFKFQLRTVRLIKKDIKESNNNGNGGN